MDSENNNRSYSQDGGEEREADRGMNLTWAEHQPSPGPDGNPHFFEPT